MGKFWLSNRQRERRRQEEAATNQRGRGSDALLSGEALRVGSDPDPTNPRSRSTSNRCFLQARDPTTSSLILQRRQEQLNFCLEPSGEEVENGTLAGVATDG